MIKRLTCAVLAIVLCLAAMPAPAQQGGGLATEQANKKFGALPDWLVPVVRVLPGDRVIPSTGIYLGGERVLVPSELTGEGADLLVLDGGADLARFGRAANVEQRFNLQGLTVLRVPGLERTAPVLGSLPVANDYDIALQAYPPAALIATGQGSVTVRSGLVRTRDVWTVAADRPLPNITGALVDACGHWIGHSAARGVASMGSSENTQYRFVTSLKPLLEASGGQWQPEACNQAWPVPAPPDAEQPVTAVNDADAGQDPVPPEPGPDTVTEPEPPVINDPPAEEAAELPPEPAGEPPAEPEQEAAPAGPVAPVSAPASEGVNRFWWGAALAAILLAVGVYWRRRKTTEATPSHDGAQPMSAGSPDIEPVARLVSTRVQHLVNAERGRVDLVLGRFDADLLLASASASRRHARLHGSPGDLLIEDLGSSNGTWCNGVRCKPFEAVPVRFGDELLFADESLHLEAPQPVVASDS